jgi:hypothetical protein
MAEDTDSTTEEKKDIWHYIGYYGGSLFFLIIISLALVALYKFGSYIGEFLVNLIKN